MIPLDWNPSSGIDVLMTQLKHGKPLLATGSFGSAFYEDVPKEGNGMGHYQVLDWRGAKRNSNEVNGRIVLKSIAIVGASRNNTEANGSMNNSGCIFYIDTDQDSDPNQPQVRRSLHLLSYEDFALHCADEFGGIMQKGVMFKNEQFGKQKRFLLG